MSSSPLYLHNLPFYTYQQLSFCTLLWLGRIEKTDELKIGFAFNHNAVLSSNRKLFMVIADTLKYLIIVQHLQNTYTKGKTPFHMACKEGQFDVVELNNYLKGFKYQFECSSYEWNDSFCTCTVIRYSRVMRRWNARKSLISNFSLQTKKGWGNQ